MACLRGAITASSAPIALPQANNQCSVSRSEESRDEVLQSFKKYGRHDGDAGLRRGIGEYARRMFADGREQTGSGGADREWAVAAGNWPVLRQQCVIAEAGQRRPGRDGLYKSERAVEQLYQNHAAAGAILGRVGGNGVG